LLVVNLAIYLSWYTRSVINTLCPFLLEVLSKIAFIAEKCTTHKARARIFPFQSRPIHSEHCFRRGMCLLNGLIERTPMHFSSSRLYYFPCPIKNVHRRGRRLKGYREIISATLQYWFTLISWQVQYIKFSAARFYMEENKSLQTL
jgi:hypothetical protein